MTGVMITIQTGDEHDDRAGQPSAQRSQSPHDRRFYPAAFTLQVSPLFATDAIDDRPFAHDSYRSGLIDGRFGGFLSR
jgi:hypothetical protein